MGLLSLNTIPSELLAGSVFSANFESTVRVIQNGGVLTGTPLVDRGITLNGVDEFVQYNLQGNEFDSPYISLVIEFYPDFDYDVDSNVYLLDTNAPNRTVILKNNNASGNNLLLYLGATTLIATIPPATYSPYWEVGKRNCLVVSGTSGDTSVWLNGTLIANSSSVVWTPGFTSFLTLGVRYSGASPTFEGKFTRFEVFQSLLNTQDAQVYYDQTVGNVLDDVSMYLPLSSRWHDPSHVYDAPQDLNDGNMEDPLTTAYASGNSALLSKEIDAHRGGSRCLRVTYNGVANPRANQSGVLTLGKSSRFTGWAQSDGILYPSVYEGAVNLWDGALLESWQFLDFERYPLATDIGLMATGSQAGFCDFDEFYIRELILADGNMQASGLGPWPIRVGTPSKQPDGSGGQCLRLTGAGATAHTYQSVLETDVVYQIRGEGRGDSLSGYPVLNSDDVVDIWTGIPANVWRPFNFLFTAAGPDLYLYMRGGPGYAEFNNLVVEKHEPRTVDVSGKGNHALLGLGTPASVPTKLTASAGFFFDGGDALTVPDSASLRIGTNDFFIAFLMNRQEANGNVGYVTKGWTGSGEWGILSGSSQNNVAFVGDGATRIEIGSYVLDATYWDGKDRTIFVTRVGDLMHLYLDGVLEVEESGLGSLNLDSSVDVTIGSRGSSGFYKGDIKSVIINTTKGLSSVQALGLHQDMMRGMRNV